MSATDDVVANAVRFFWLEGQTHSSQRDVAFDGFAVLGETADGAAEDGALAHSVDSTEHVHSRTQVPEDVPGASPERFYFDAFDVKSNHR